MKSLFISTKGKRDRGKQYLMYQTSLCKWMVEQEFEVIAKRQKLQEIIESHDRQCHIEENFITYLSVDTNCKISEHLLLVDEAC